MWYSLPEQISKDRDVYWLCQDKLRRVNATRWRSGHLRSLSSFQDAGAPSEPLCHRQAVASFRSLSFNHDTVFLVSGKRSNEPKKLPCKFQWQVNLKANAFFPPLFFLFLLMHSGVLEDTWLGWCNLWWCKATVALHPWVHLRMHTVKWNIKGEILFQWKGGSLIWCVYKHGSQKSFNTLSEPTLNCSILFTQATKVFLVEKRRKKQKIKKGT